MPLRALASKLRKALTPLVAERLKEQEEKVQKLLAHAELQDIVSRERRLLETLRHCNPVAARDRTLGNLTQGCFAAQSVHKDCYGLSTSTRSTLFLKYFPD